MNHWFFFHFFVNEVLYQIFGLFHFPDRINIRILVLKKPVDSLFFHVKIISENLLTKQIHQMCEKMRLILFVFCVRITMVQIESMKWIVRQSKRTL